MGGTADRKSRVSQMKQAQKCGVGNGHSVSIRRGHVFHSLHTGIPYEQTCRLIESTLSTMRGSMSSDRRQFLKWGTALPLFGWIAAESVWSKAVAAVTKNPG